MLDLADRTGSNKESTMSLLKLLPNTIKNVKEAKIGEMLSNIWKVMGFGSLDSAVAELYGEIQVFKDFAVENWSLDDCIENSKAFSVLHALLKR